VPSVNNRASTAVGGGLRAKPPPHKTRSSPIGYAQKPTSSHHHVAEVPLTVLSLDLSLPLPFPFPIGRQIAPVPHFPRRS